MRNRCEKRKSPRTEKTEKGEEKIGIEKDKSKTRVRKRRDEKLQEKRKGKQQK